MNKKRFIISILFVIFEIQNNIMGNGTSLDVQKVKTYILGIATNVPGVETHVPGVETNVPGVETNVPGVETNVPGVETNVPAVVTHVPNIENNYIASNTHKINENQNINLSIADYKEYYSKMQYNPNLSNKKYYFMMVGNFLSIISSIFLILMKLKLIENSLLFTLIEDALLIIICRIMIIILSITIMIILLYDFNKYKKAKNSNDINQYKQYIIDDNNINQLTKQRRYNFINGLSIGISFIFALFFFIKKKFFSKIIKSIDSKFYEDPDITAKLLFRINIIITFILSIIYIILLTIDNKHNILNNIKNIFNDNNNKYNKYKKYIDVSFVVLYFYIIKFIFNLMILTFLKESIRTKIKNKKIEKINAYFNLINFITFFTLEIIYFFCIKYFFLLNMKDMWSLYFKNNNFWYFFHEGIVLIFLFLTAEEKEDDAYNDMILIINTIIVALFKIIYSLKLIKNNTKKLKLFNASMVNKEIL